MGIRAKIKKSKERPEDFGFKAGAKVLVHGNYMSPNQEWLQSARRQAKVIQCTDRIVCFRFYAEKSTDPQGNYCECLQFPHDFFHQRIILLSNL